MNIKDVTDKLLMDKILIRASEMIKDSELRTFILDVIKVFAVGFGEGFANGLMKNGNR
jgi:hypothetical protein